MANFTLETNRNNAIANIPRITFQLPQSTSGSVASTRTPIYFCQTGCQLEFQFNNITSAQLKNDGNYFTIIPTGNSNNYINWNGSGASGQNMIRFDLKEIKFSAPARDVVGSITYNRSIQFYFTFVNSTYPNIMIVISIIGQANNVGRTQTDGFVLLNALTNQIPLRNDTRTVSNLGNVNLGNLLPPNKSFFSTLINGNNIQYISMTRIIDIPENFLNNMISRVVGSQQAYTAKVNQFTQELPTNPEGTIIFYTENIKPINSDQAYVCNANCDTVVGDASLLQPTFGSASVSRTAVTTRSPTVGGISPEKAIQEECEEEYFFPGNNTLVKVNSDSTPSTSADTSNQKDLTPNEYTSSIGQAVFIVLFLLVIIGGVILIIWFLVKATNISGFRSFFSRELWNISNAGLITIGLLGISSIIIFVSIFLDLIIKNEKNKSKEENKKTQPWIFLIIGGSIWLICFAILLYKSSNVKYSNLSEDDLKDFTTQTSKLLSDYQRSPGSKGSSDIIAASDRYKGLSPIAQSKLKESNPNVESYLNPNSKFIKNIKSSNPQLFSKQSILNNLIKKFSNYNKTQQVVSQPLINDLKNLQLVNKDNKNLPNLISKLKIGQPIPKELNKYRK